VRDAFALPVVAHGHPDLARMTPAPEGGMDLQAHVPDHLAADAGYQGVETLGPLGETFAPHLCGRERELQGTLDHPRAAKDPVQRLVVVRFGVADDYLHRRLPRSLSGMRTT
jgi:hypothetical protein